MTNTVRQDTHTLAATVNAVITIIIIISEFDLGRGGIRLVQPPLCALQQRTKLVGRGRRKVVASPIPAAEHAAMPGSCAYNR